MTEIRTRSDLDRFAPVGLDELNRHAANLTRVDRKYAISVDDLAGAVASLDPRTRILELEGQREFRYASVYFDTPARESFRLAAHRRRRRFKVRTRTYLDSGDCWLEVKTRGGRHRTVKERTPYPRADRGRLTGTAVRFVADVLAERGLDPRSAGELSAALSTEFTRTTLWLPGDSSRTTIDRRLTVSTRDGPRADFPGAVILETKSGASPSAVDRLLWSRGIRPAKVSKFAVGMAAIDDTLPHNRWLRVMRGPLAPQHLDVRTAPTDRTTISDHPDTAHERTAR
jgi:hypothetical protein